jgi:hypothetical protein
MADVRRYQSWWTWLREFDGTDLAQGEVWRCRVQPPAPYTVAFTVTLDEVEDGRRVAGTVRGDVEGSAELRIARRGHGSEVHLISSLAPRHPTLRALAVLGRPFVRFGHDWVLDAGAREFDRQVIGGRGRGGRPRAR